MDINRANLMTGQQTQRPVAAAGAWPGPSARGDQICRAFRDHDGRGIGVRPHKQRHD